jgi:hypothetical protein
MRVVRNFDVQHDLRDAGAVAQVKEDEIAVVAPAINPAHQNNVLPILLHTELAAPVSALQVT